MRLSIRADTGALSRGLQARAASLPPALARGLNAGGDKVRTQVQRALKEQTGVKLLRSITSRVTTIRAGPGRLEYDIIARGPGIPIKEFPVSVNGRGVDARPWGVDHQFARSFRQRFKGGLVARRGNERFPIRKLYGPSLAKELLKGQVPGVFMRTVATEVVPAVLAAIESA